MTPDNMKWFEMAKPGVNISTTVAEIFTALNGIDVDQCPALSLDPGLFLGVSWFFGKRIIRKGGESVLLFDHCEYCHQTDIQQGLYGQYICRACGAPT